MWCWNFIFDRTSHGTALKWLSIVNEYTRKSLCLKVDRGITSEDVVDTLAELFAIRGVPNHIRSDNGPEFTAKTVQKWLKQLGVETMDIEPGSPRENGYAESFHSRMRDEFLALEEFKNLEVARRMTRTWRDDYNQHRPHSSLKYMTPIEYASQLTSAPAQQTGPPHGKPNVFYPNQTLIRLGTGFRGRPQHLAVTRQMLDAHVIVREMKLLATAIPFIELFCEACKLQCHNDLYE